jgi:hypothetical protein
MRPIKDENMKQDGPKTAGEAFEKWADGNLEITMSATSSRLKRWAKMGWEAAIAHAKSQPSEVAMSGKQIVSLTSEDCEMASLGDKINNHFEKQGHEDWQLGSVASRKLVWKLEARAESAEAELASLKEKFEQSSDGAVRLLKQRDEAQTELDQIKELLPDESPCKHEETGHSLYDDIHDALKERDDLKDKLSNALWRMDYAESQLTSLQQDRNDLKAKLAQSPWLPFQSVIAELERATTKFPTWPTDPLHALAVLGEEFGELTKEVVQFSYEPNKTSRDEVRKEATQTAAMALRFFLSLDAYQYAGSGQHSQDGKIAPTAEAEKERSAAWMPKFKVGDMVRSFDGGYVGTVVREAKSSEHSYAVKTQVGTLAFSESELKKWSTPTSAPMVPLEYNLIALKSMLVAAESERDRLQEWKNQMLTVESWWSKVDEFVRNHPKAPIGQNVSDIALQWLRAYMEEKSK